MTDKSATVAKVLSRVQKACLLAALVGPIRASGAYGGKPTWQGGADANREWWHPRTVHSLIAKKLLGPGVSAGTACITERGRAAIRKTHLRAATTGVVRRLKDAVDTGTRNP